MYSFTILMCLYLTAEKRRRQTAVSSIPEALPVHLFETRSPRRSPTRSFICLKFPSCHQQQPQAARKYVFIYKNQETHTPKYFHVNWIYWGGGGALVKFSLQNCSSELKLYIVCIMLYLFLIEKKLYLSEKILCVTFLKLFLWMFQVLLLYFLVEGNE